jgi:hypothetical protein
MRLAHVVLSVTVACALIAAPGCGGDDDDKGDEGASGKTAATETTETAPAAPPPEPGTLDGTWSGQTPSGEEISFEVDGNKISNVTMPGNPKCGNGIGTTVETSTRFRGNKFEVPGLPLPYMVFDKKTGESTNATDQRTVEGKFTSTTEASGRVVTEVQEDGSSDRCVQKWTATRG